MELYVRIFILHLLCVAHAFVVTPKEIAEFKAEPLTYVEDLSRTPVQESDGIDGQSTETPRDKRALGLLLSGLAQIFGYTVTPVQYASLPNPNPKSEVTRPVAMSNSSKPVNVSQQAASSRRANTTMPRQQETIRFTGVLNLGNNSNILGHLQQYEQIFHGPQNMTMTMMTTSRPASMPPAKPLVDLETNSPETKPPLLAPFFVKIPLPIAPELLPATIPLEDLGLSYLSPPVTIKSDSNENTETPVRKEQEMEYRSHEDTERYTVEEKDIYDEKDVRKPLDKHNHQLYVDEPRNKQQNDKCNELQREQKERIEKLKQQEEERNRDKVVHYNEEEMNKRYRNREKEIANQNRNYASKQESAEERRPAHNDEEDEDSTERYREYANQEEERNRDKVVHYNEEEMNKRYRNREKEIANQNRNYASKQESAEERRPEHNDEEDEDSAEKYREYANQEEERNRDKVVHYNKEEMNKRYRNREKEIANQNRNYASKQESAEERRPTHNDEEDEDSAERYREYASQENLSNESAKQPQKKDEKEEIEDYPNYDDDSNKQSNGYKQPEDLNKYVEVGYNNQQLPIGDYFHEGNPEVVRDSYGKILDNKKLEDDRISDYINMFKHPHVQANVYDSERAHNPEDASREENEKETSAEDGYDEHLVRLQKLREEYALPENKYEEYDLNDESEADRNDRKSERIQNRTSLRSRRPNIERLRGKEDSRMRRPIQLNHNDAARLENAKSQEEVDFTRYMPLVVPVRYIDANDKIQQTTTRQLNYKEADKSTDSRFSEDNVSTMQTTLEEKLTPQIGLPEKPRQLHECDYKELQVWPPPFDYAFDYTEPATTIVPPNPGNYYPRNYAPNYYQHVVKEIAAQDANDKSTEQPSGYLVVVGNPAYPYRYPYNIYYFSNEAVNSRGQVSHLNGEVTRPRDHVYVAQQSANQQITLTKPNITEYNPNETTNSPRDYYHQPQEVPTNILDRYKYIFEERTSQVKEPLNIDIISQIPNTHLNAEVTHPRNQVYVAQQSASQQIIQTKPNITEYNLNETTNSPRDYYYQPITTQEVPANVLDRYRYIFEERTPQAKKSYNIDIISQIPNAENWSNRIYRPQSPSNTAEQSSRPVFAQLQNIASLNQNVQNGLPERLRHSRLLRKRRSLRPENQRKDEEAKIPPEPILKSKTFDDPQSAHDFFGFSKDDYNFESESSDATKVAEENGKTTEESDVFVAPEPTVYHYDDESIVEHIDEPENDTEKTKVKEYRNKVATLRVSERRQLKPNGPIHYVDFIRNI